MLPMVLEVPLRRGWVVFSTAGTAIMLFRGIDCWESGKDLTRDEFDRKWR